MIFVARVQHYEKFILKSLFLPICRRFFCMNCGSGRSWDRKYTRVHAARGADFDRHGWFLKSKDEGLDRIQKSA
jgi:hypothetical protein